MATLPDDIVHKVSPDGLSKRELFAIEIMGGLLSDHRIYIRPTDELAVKAVASADELIIALNLP